MENERIKIFISGDFAPRLRVKQLIDARNYDLIYNDIISHIKNSDIAITNLESPLINEGKQILKTGRNLKSSENSIEALKFAGFNLVTLANNHIMDFGNEGLKSTIEISKKNNIEYVGAGNTLNEASEIKYINCKNRKIAFINVAENEWSTTDGDQPGANPLDVVNVFHQINEAKFNSEFVIILIHGGHETFEYPSPRMKKLYRFFIDAGANAVIGHHTHCFSGYEIYNGKLIVYSLGNFLFDHESNRNNTSWNIGCAVNLYLDDRVIEFELLPFYQCNNNPGIRLFTDDEKKEFLIKEKEKTEIIKNDEFLKSKFDIFINEQRFNYQELINPVSNKLLARAFSKISLPLFFKPNYKNLLLNLIRCESHRDILISILNPRKDCK